MNNIKPLAGMRVLDLTVALSGPYASMLLGGLGAEVIRIEAPGGGDIGRSNPPFVGQEGIHFDACGADDLSLTMLNRTRNKKSITLNLKSEKGRELFAKLAQHSDVIIQNMSEGVVDRLGIGYERIRCVNPRIIYASINAFGEPSVYPGLKGMDIIVQALSGVMGATGFADGPPVRAGVPIADLLAPLYAVQGILAACIERGRSGEGQHVEVSMLECLASWLAEEHFDVLDQFDYRIRTGNSHDRLAPFGIFQTVDGHVAIVAVTPPWFKGLTQAMGMPELLEDPRFAERGPRVRNVEALNEIIQTWTRTRASADVIDVLSGTFNVPCAAVRSPLEVLSDPQLRAKKAIVELEHPLYGKIGAVGMGLPIHFSRSRAEFDEPAPLLGAANRQVYGELLGLSNEEIDGLQAQHIL